MKYSMSSGWAFLGHHQRRLSVANATPKIELVLIINLRTHPVLGAAHLRALRAGFVLVGPTHTSTCRKMSLVSIAKQPKEPPPWFSLPSSTLCCGGEVTLVTTRQVALCALGQMRTDGAAKIGRTGLLFKRLIVDQMQHKID